MNHKGRAFARYVLVGVAALLLMATGGVHVAHAYNDACQPVLDKYLYDPVSGEPVTYGSKGLTPPVGKGSGDKIGMFDQASYDLGLNPSFDSNYGYAFTKAVIPTPIQYTKRVEADEGSINPGYLSGPGDDAYPVGFGNIRGVPTATYSIKYVIRFTCEDHPPFVVKAGPNNAGVEQISNQAQGTFGPYTAVEGEGFFANSIDFYFEPYEVGNTPDYTFGSNIACIERDKTQNYKGYYFWGMLYRDGITGITPENLDMEKFYSPYEIWGPRCTPPGSLSPAVGRSTPENDPSAPPVLRLPTFENELTTWGAPPSAPSVPPVTPPPTGPGIPTGDPSMPTPPNFSGYPVCVSGGSVSYWRHNQLSWTPVVGATSYNIYISNDGASYIPLTSTTVATYQHIVRTGPTSGFIPNACGTLGCGNLYYKIVAVNSTGKISLPSNQVYISVQGEENSSSGGCYSDPANPPRMPFFDFSLSNSGFVAPLTTGTVANTTVTATLLGGSVRLPVRLETSVVPPGFSIPTLVPQNVNPTETSSMAVSVPPTALGGSYSMTVRGTFGGLGGNDGSCSVRRTGATDWLDCSVGGVTLPSLEMNTASSFSSATVASQYFTSTMGGICGSSNSTVTTGAVSFTVGGTESFRCVNPVTRTTVVTFSVANQQPDLIAQNVVVTPSSGPYYSGSTLTLSGQVANTGSVAVTTSFTNFFRVQTLNASNAVISEVDVLPSVTIPTIGATGTADATKTIGGTWTLPSTGTAKYRFLLCADTGANKTSGVIVEKDESNNCSLPSGIIQQAELPTNVLTVRALREGSALTGANGVTIASVPAFFGGVTEYTRSTTSPIIATLTAPSILVIGGAPALFSSWTGCSAATGNQCEVRNLSVATITANYVNANLNLEISKNASGPWEKATTIEYTGDLYARWSGSNLGSNPIVCTAIGTPAVSSWSGGRTVSSAWSAAGQIFGIVGGTALRPSVGNPILSLNCSLPESRSIASSVSVNVCPAPVILSVSQVTPSAVTLVWNAAPLATTYTLSVSTDAGVNKNYTTIYSGSATSYIQTGRSPSTTYYYRLEAQNSNGSCSKESLTSATTPDPVPTTFSIDLKPDSALDRDAPANIAFTATWSGTATGPVNLSYRCTTAAPYVTAGPFDAPTTSFTFNCAYATAGDRTFARIEAVRQAIPASDQSEVSTKLPTVAGLDGQPGLCGSPVTGGRINLSWNAASGSFAGYRIYYSTSPLMTGAQSKSVTSDKTGDMLEGLLPNTNYSIKVVTVKVDGTEGLGGVIITRISSRYCDEPRILAFSASPNPIDYGSNSGLTWTSQYTKSCKGVGFFTGIAPQFDNVNSFGGTQRSTPLSVGPLLVDTKYTLICSALFPESGTSETSEAATVYVRPQVPNLTTSPIMQCADYANKNDNSSTLVWPRAALAEQYTLTWSTTSGGAGTPLSVPAPAADGSTTVNHTGLSEGTTYYYTLVARRTTPIGVLTSTTTKSAVFGVCPPPPENRLTISATNGGTPVAAVVTSAGTTLGTTQVLKTSLSAISYNGGTAIRAPRLAQGDTLRFKEWLGCDSEFADADGINVFCNVSLAGGAAKTVTAEYNARPAATLDLAISADGVNWVAGPLTSEFNGPVSLRWSGSNVRNCTAATVSSTLSGTQNPDTSVVTWNGSRSVSAGVPQSGVILSNANAASVYSFTLRCEDSYVPSTIITRTVKAYVKPRTPRLALTPSLISPPIAAPSPCARIDMSWAGGTSALHGEYNLRYSSNGGTSYSALSSAIAPTATASIHSPVAGKTLHTYELTAQTSIDGVVLVSNPAVAQVTTPACAGDSSFDFALRMQNVSVYRGNSTTTSVGRLNTTLAPHQNVTLALQNVRGPAPDIVAFSASSGTLINHTAKGLRVEISPSSGAVALTDNATPITITTSPTTPLGIYTVTLQGSAVGPAAKTNSFTIEVLNPNPTCTISTDVTRTDWNAPTSRVNVTWTSQNAQTCVGASDGATSPTFSTSNATAGTNAVNSFVRNPTTFSLTCTNATTGLSAICSAPSVCVLPGPALFAATPANPASGSGRVNLTWTPSPLVTKYRLYRSLTAGFTPSAANLITEILAGTTDYVDTGLTVGTLYHYAIIPENSCGDGTTQRSSTNPSSPAPQPNFVVSIAPQAPVGAGVGRPIPLSGVVRNAGLADITGRLNSVFTVKNSSTGVAVFTSAPVPAPNTGFAPGTSQTFTASSWTAAISGSYYIELCADYPIPGLFSESNETDNCGISPVFTIAKPDVILSAPDVVVAAGASTVSQLLKRISPANNPAVPEPITISTKSVRSPSGTTTAGNCVSAGGGQLCVTPQAPLSTAPDSQTELAIAAVPAPQVGFYDVVMSGLNPANEERTTTFRVQVTAPSAVDCNLTSAPPTQVGYNSLATLQWTSTGASYCTGSSNNPSAVFNTGNNTSGITNVTGIRANTTFGLSCVNTLSAQTCNRNVSLCVKPGSSGFLATTPSVASGTGKVQLNWVTAPLATGYRLYRGTSPLSNPPVGTPIATLGVSAVSYTDTGLTPGTTYYYALESYNACGSLIENDFTIASIESNKPNFVIASGPTLSIPAPVAGQAVTISAVVRNAGLADISSGSITSTFTVTRVGTGAVRFTNQAPSPSAGFAVNASKTFSTGTTSWTAEVGDYVINVCADSPALINESNESDNCAAVTINVAASVSGVDLIVSSGPSTNNPVPGNSTIFVSGAMKNAGTIDIPASTLVNVRFTLTNTVTNATEFTHTVVGASGLAKDTIRQNNDIGVTWAVRAGDYRLEYCVDSTNVVSESNESNNCAQTAFAIAEVLCVPPSPSLLVATISGSNVNLVWARSTGAYRYEVHRSATNGFTPSSSTLITSFAGTESSPSMATSYTDVNVPGVSTGTVYYYTVVAKNDCAQVLASDALQPLPDLYISYLGRFALTQFDAFAYNGGEVSVPNSIMVRTSFLATDKLTGATEGPYTVTAVAPSEGFPLIAGPSTRKTFNSPVFTQLTGRAGHTIRACVDSTGLVNESDENNNCREIDIPVDEALCLPSGGLTLDASQGANTGSITLTWSGSSAVTSYSLYRSETPGFTPSPANRIGTFGGGAGPSQITDYGRTPGVTYYYEILAQDACGQSSKATSIKAYDPSAGGTVSIDFEISNQSDMSMANTWTTVDWDKPVYLRWQVYNADSCSGVGGSVWPITAQSITGNGSNPGRSYKTENINNNFNILPGGPFNAFRGYTIITLSCQNAISDASRQVSVYINEGTKPLDGFEATGATTVEYVFSKSAVITKPITVSLSPTEGFVAPVNLRVTVPSGSALSGANGLKAPALESPVRVTLGSEAKTDAKIDITIPRSVPAGSYPITVTASGTNSEGTLITRTLNYTIKVIHINPDFKEI